MAERTGGDHKLGWIGTGRMGYPLAQRLIHAGCDVSVLNLSPTFTPVLLRRDFDLGLAAARDLDVPMPVAALVREIVQSLIGRGDVDADFAKLLEQQAAASNHDLNPEGIDVPDGLEDESG
jgi:3-hydroxyisobutyrate dehydrogenase-like beta-hydroxyacid dehydrogenase